eukprot:15438345-Alexandrium_andersonii.AAC.1
MSVSPKEVRADGLVDSADLDAWLARSRVGRARLAAEGVMVQGPTTPQAGLKRQELLYGVHQASPALLVHLPREGGVEVLEGCSGAGLEAALQEAVPREAVPQEVADLLDLGNPRRPVG